MEVERLSRTEWRRLKRIRLAVLEDAPDAFGTTIEAAREMPDDAWRQQTEDLPTFVVTLDGSDVGMVRGTAAASKSDAYLISMWVSPNVRGRRVGEELINAIVAWARDAGFSRLLLDVADDNSPAIALYERLGFRPTGETSRYPSPRSHITEHRRARTL